MPPEMILKKFYTRSIDYYAIGALLYEMIEGIPPFYSNKRKKLFSNIVNKEVKFHRQCSFAVKDLIKRLLNKNHKKRLGNKGIQEIKNHPFFESVDWEELFLKNVEPPYKPSMREINFSKEFTSIPVTFNFEEEINRNQSILTDRVTTPPHDTTSKAKNLLSTFGDVAFEAFKEMGAEDLENPFHPARKVSEPNDRTSFFQKFNRPSLETTPKPSAADKAIKETKNNGKINNIDEYLEMLEDEAKEDTDKFAPPKIESLPMKQHTNSSIEIPDADDNEDLKRYKSSELNKIPLADAGKISIIFKHIFINNLEVSD